MESVDTGLLVRGYVITKAPSQKLLLLRLVREYAGIQPASISILL